MPDPTFGVKAARQERVEAPQRVPARSRAKRRAAARGQTAHPITGGTDIAAAVVKAAVCFPRSGRSD